MQAGVVVVVVVGEVANRSYTVSDFGDTYYLTTSECSDATLVVLSCRVRFRARLWFISMKS